MMFSGSVSVIDYFQNPVFSRLLEHLQILCAEQRGLEKFRQFFVPPDSCLIFQSEVKEENHLCYHSLLY